MNGAVATRNRPAWDNGWSLSLIDIPLTEFNKSIVKYPNIERFPGGASNDIIPTCRTQEPAALRSDEAAGDRRLGQL